MTVVVAAMVPIVPVVMVTVTFNDHYLIDVSHRREGVDWLHRLSVGGTEADHTYRDAGKSEEFTHRMIGDRNYFF